MRLYLIAGAAVVLALGLAWSHSAAYRAGGVARQAAFAAKINQENDDAGKSAEKWRSDLRRCSDAGGLFDFESGTCDQ